MRTSLLSKSSLSCYKQLNGYKGSGGNKKLPPHGITMVGIVRKVPSSPAQLSHKHCHTRSWGPGFIVGFRKVKIPSIRSILYSNTWWVKDRGTYHEWLNQRLDWHTLHHKLVGERSDMVSEQTNVPLSEHVSRLRFVFCETKLAKAKCQLSP